MPSIMQIISAFAITFSSFSVLASALPQGTVNGQTCPPSPPGVANSNNNGVCCAGIFTTASGGGDACCVGGSFSMSQPDGFPFGTATQLISIPVGSCSTVIPVTAAGYTSLVFGAAATATGASSGPSSGAAPAASAGPSSSSSKAGASSPMITQGPILALAGLAAGAALL